MPAVRLTPALAGEYTTLFQECAVRAERRADVDRLIDAIAAQRPRYEAVAQQTGVPWHVVAVVHAMEASLRFDRHLHNGDPLTARTRQVPAGRPREGQPPFSWEESAVDALRHDRMDRWTDWSLAGTLYKLEGYNGWGYRRHHPEVRTPYLWSFSNHYTSGKYVSDGRFSATAVSRQCGAAVILRRMAERGIITLTDGQPADADGRPADAGGDGAGQPLAPAPVEPGIAPAPRLRFDPGTVVTDVEHLQRFLNVLGEIVRVDGKAGDKTSDAVRRAFGHYLHGDPRGEA